MSKHMLDVIAVGPSTATDSGSGVVIELRDRTRFDGFQRWFRVPDAIKTEVLTVAAEAIRGGKRVYTSIKFDQDYRSIDKHPGPIDIEFICLKP